MNPIMKHLLHPAALAGVLLLAACAGTGAAPEAAPAAAVNGLSQQDRVDLFVHDARVGDVSALKKDLKSGAPINTFDSLGQNALIAAISYNSLDEVKLLLAHGADPNLPDRAGWISLHFAAWFGSSSELISQLLDHGAKIDTTNDRGITPLYFASVSGHESQVRLLLQRGADRSIASKSGYTPLRAAKVKGYFSVVALLDPNAAKAAAAAAPKGATN
jgi:ankyrin repeat protein